MKRDQRYRLVMGVTLSLLAIAGLTATILWADARTERLAAEKLDDHVGVIMRRSAQTRAQQLAFVQAMKSAPPIATCSPEHLARMRAVSAPSAYIHGVGVMSGTTLVCSTLTPKGKPIELGPPDRIGINGFRSWNTVNLPGLDAPFKIDVREDYAMLLLSAQVMDSGTRSPGVSLAHIGTARRPWTLIRQRGQYDFSGILAHYDGSGGSFWQDDHLFVAHTVSEPKAVFIGVMDRAGIAAQFWQALGQVALAGILITALVMALAFHVIRQRFSLRAEIRRALKNREFHMFYQPVVSLDGGRFVGAEALIRWTRDDGRQVNPGEFIPAAEEAGLINEVTHMVIELVADDVARLVKAVPNAHIAINLAPSDVDSPLTQVWLTKMVERTKICCDNVMVEITERGVVDHDAKDKLGSIRARGFRSAIDDFGTGQSSLSQIATYNFDFLKIDKSFVDVVCTDTLSSKVAFNVIHLAKSLGMQMIAEGVETQEQATVLKQAGVQYAQGWLFARAMPFDDMLRFAQRHPAAA